MTNTFKLKKGLGRGLSSLIGDTNKTSKSKGAVYEWDSWLMALRDSTEVRSQQIQMGRSLAKWEGMSNPTQIG